MHVILVHLQIVHSIYLVYLDKIFPINIVPEGLRVSGRSFLQGRSHTLSFEVIVLLIINDAIIKVTYPPGNNIPTRYS